MSKRWSAEEDSLLKKLWWELPRKQVFATMSDRTPKAITKRALFLGLRRSGEATKKMQRKWSPEEIDTLRDLWWNHTPKEVFALLPEFTPLSVAGKASKLRLKRSPETAQRLLEGKKQLLLHRNTKILGRERNYENAKKVASLYNSRTEFYRKDNSMYTYIRQNGLWGELCGHMQIGNFNYSESFLFECIRCLFPGQEILRNSRKIIKPYELDVYVPSALVAFEYDGSNWHNSQEVSERDAVKSKLCEEAGIRLCRIQEIREQRHIPEAFIVRSLAALGYDTSNINVESCTQSAFAQGYPADAIRDCVSRYTRLSDFRKEQSQLYSLLCRKGIAGHFLSHLDRIWCGRTTEEVDAALDTVTTATAFRDKYPHLYQVIKRQPSKYALQLDRYLRMRLPKYNKGL